METTEKNKPGPLVIAAFAIIILMIVFYFIIASFFPDLLESMNVGESQPVK